VTDITSLLDAPIPPVEPVDTTPHRLTRTSSLVRAVNTACATLRFNCSGCPIHRASHWSAELSSHFALGSDFLGYGSVVPDGPRSSQPVRVWLGREIPERSRLIRHHPPCSLVVDMAARRDAPMAQSAAIVVGELVAFIWMCEVALEFSRGCTPPALSDFREDDGVLNPSPTHLSTPTVLALLGLIILVGNPWMYWSASFDYHLELLGGCFAMLLAYDVAHHRKRAWLWLILTALSGDVAITYIFGVGLSALVAGRAWRRWGITLVTARLWLSGWSTFSV